MTALATDVYLDMPMITGTVQPSRIMAASTVKPTPLVVVADLKITTWRVRFWTGFHVVVWMSVLWLLMLGDYEEHVYRRFVEKLVQPGMSGEQAAVALTHEVYDRLINRREIWSGYDGGVRDWLLPSADTELLAPAGACGSCSLVLGKALQSAGYKVRFVQMKVGEIPGGHTMIEAEVEPGRWAVLGPTFNVIFVRPDGKLASFADVHNDWPYYEKQVPPGYDHACNFAEVRYTNWDKFPVVMPLLRTVLTLVLGEERVSTLSLRSYLTNRYYTYVAIIASGYVLLLAVRTIIRHRRRPSPLAAAHLA